MFIPNTTGKLSRRGRTNVYGRVTYDPAIVVQCGVVHLIATGRKTSVRTDSSASRGAGEENTAFAKILFPANVPIGRGDRFEIMGDKLRVVGIEKRLDVNGRLDHLEVTLDIYEEAAS